MLPENYALTVVKVMMRSLNLHENSEAAFSSSFEMSHLESTTSSHFKQFVIIRYVEIIKYIHAHAEE